MKKNELTKIVKECVKEVLQEETAAVQAKRKGLESAGFGRWKNKQGKVVATTVDGKLVMSKPGDNKKN